MKARLIRLVAPVATVLLAVGVAAGDFDVPQGGGKLPTIALVECLAQDGSRTEGQYCRTTYECTPQRDGTVVSGTLWEGLTYADGRRVTLETDDIARERSCVLSVEDGAKVSYFTGYRPEGKDGDVVAFTRAGSHTLTLTVGSSTVPTDNMLGQFLSHHAVRADTLEDWVEIDEPGYCGQWSPSTCAINGTFIEGIPATEKTACYVEARLNVSGTPYTWLGHLKSDWVAQQYATAYQYDPECNDL